MKLVPKKFLVFILSSVAYPDVRATRDNTIGPVRGLRGSMSGIDLNSIPEILPEGYNRIETRREGQEDVLEVPGTRGDIMHSGHRTPHTDLRAWADNSSASTAFSSDVQTSGPSIERTTSGKRTCGKKSAARGISKRKIKMRPLAHIYRSNEALEKSVSMSDSQGSSSSPKSSQKLSSEWESRAPGLDLSRPKKRKGVIERSTVQKKSIEGGKLQRMRIGSKVLRHETFPLTLESSSQKEQSPERDGEPDESSKELLELISLVNKSQNQGRLSNGVNPQTKYPPLFKKMVIESLGDFETHAEAAAHHNISETCLSRWKGQYIKRRGNMDCWNYIEEREKFKKEVVEWHKRHGSNIAETSEMFHIHNNTLRSWLKAEENLDAIGSFLSSKTPQSKLKVTRYPDELQKAVVGYYQKSGDSQRKVSAVLGLPHSNISTWQKKFRSEEEMEKNELSVTTPIH